MSNTEDQGQYLKEKKTDVLSVDPRLVAIEEGFNPRKDFGDIDELKEQIVQQGVLVPLSGDRKELESGVKGYVLTDGERRLRAVRKAIEEGYDIKYIPFKLNPKNMNEEKRLIHAMMKNEGKKLTMVEEGEAFERLVNYGYTQSEIAKLMGKSEAQVGQAVKLANAPKRVREKIEIGEISGGTVVNIMRETDDENEQVEQVEKAIESAQKEAETKGKDPKKATDRHAKTKKRSPFKKLKELSEKLQEAEDVDEEKAGLISDLVEKLQEEEDVDKIVEAVKG